MRCHDHYCGSCIHGKRNSGLVIAVEKEAYFCTRLTKIRDEDVAAVIEPLLRQLASERKCPHHDSGEGLPDSYKAIDL